MSISGPQNSISISGEPIPVNDITYIDPDNMHHSFYSEDPRCWKCKKLSRYSLVSHTDITTRPEFFGKHDGEVIYDNIHAEPCISHREAFEKGWRPPFAFSNKFEFRNEKNKL